MYEQHFNLNSRPFTLIPLVEHFFPSNPMQKSLETAKLCIDRGTGPVVVIGEPGTGKSLLLSLLDQNYRDQFNIASLFCSKLDKRQELLQNILFELQLPYRNQNEGELRLNLMDFLRSDESSKNGVLLLLDEAHNLTIELLDEIRLISQIVRGGLPKVRTVLAGNFRLEESLTDPRLVSLNQLIAGRCYLSPLTRAETAGYIVDHIDRAGGNGKRIFDEASLNQIHDLTDGCPRTINQVCDHALMLAANHGRLTIDQCWVSQAWSDLQNYSFSAESLRNSCLNKLDPGSNDCAVIEYGSLLEDSFSESESASESEPLLEPESTLEPQSVFDSKPALEPESAWEPETFSESDSGWEAEPFNQNDAEHDDSILHQQPWEQAFLAEPVESEQPDSTHAEIQETFQSESQDPWKSQDQTQIESQDHSEWESQDHCEWESQNQPQWDSLNQSHWESHDSSETESQWDLASDLNDSAHGIADSAQDHASSASDENPISISARDPFAEEFEDEEIIQDRYAPLVAAYNRSSLEVTSDELSVLSECQPKLESSENLEAEKLVLKERETNIDKDHQHPHEDPQSTDSVESEAVSSIENEAESLLKEMYQNLGESPLLDDVESNADQLPVSEGGDKNGLDDQGFSSFSPFSFASKAGSADETNPSPWNIKPFSPDDGSFQMEAVKPIESSVPTVAEDDRDIIVCDIPDLPFVPVSSSHNSDRVLFPSTPVSTGKAQRMDYQELFVQLRNLTPE